MKGVWIKTYTVKKDQPYSKFSDQYSIFPFNEFTQHGPNIWKGSFGPYQIIVTQKHRHHEINEDEIEITTNKNFKGEPDTTYAYPSKSDIIKSLNEYLDDIYG
jgi:hypothetical protein